MIVIHIFALMTKYVRILAQDRFVDVQMVLSLITKQTIV